MTYLVDSSVWVDYLRGADTPAAAQLETLLRTSAADVATTEQIAMELLAGPTSESVVAQLTRLVDGLPLISMDPLLDFRAAASIFRACRRAGVPVRGLADCLIAAVAIRAGVKVLHKDADFEAIAAVTHLETLSWR